MPETTSPERYYDILWESLTPEMKDRCVRRRAGIRLDDFEFIAPATPMQLKWDTELYPPFHAVLKKNRAWILGNSQSDVHFTVHFLMIKIGYGLEPSLIVICSDFSVATRVIQSIPKSTIATFADRHIYVQMSSHDLLSDEPLQHTELRPSLENFFNTGDMIDFEPVVRLEDVFEIKIYTSTDSASTGQPPPPYALELYEY